MLPLLSGSRLRLIFLLYAGQDVHLDIKYTSNYQYYVYIDDVTIEPAPTDPVADISVDMLDFGIVQVGQSSSLDLTVSNTGSGTLTGTMTTDAPVFTVNPPEVSVAAGESATVTVTYTPSRDADDAGILTLDHNGNGASLTVSLSGSGTNNLLTEGFEGTWPPAGWTADAELTLTDIPLIMGAKSLWITKFWLRVGIL